MYKKILVLDDEKDLCDLIERILHDNGYEVECAYTLKEGQRKWDLIHPPVVLLDNNFPDGTGLQLVRENPSLLEKTKVIMISADMDPDTRAIAKEIGIHYFLQKPFSLRTIRDLVQEII